MTELVDSKTWLIFSKNRFFKCSTDEPKLWLSSAVKKLFTENSNLLIIGYSRNLKKAEPSLRKKNRNPQPAEINQAIKELIKK